jgi:hypothetical protein
MAETDRPHKTFADIRVLSVGCAPHDKATKSQGPRRRACTRAFPYPSHIIVAARLRGRDLSCRIKSGIILGQNLRPKISVKNYMSYKKSVIDVLTASWLANSWCSPVSVPDILQRA